MNYDDHAWCLKQLEAAQEADHDNREAAREAKLFVTKRDGQWEADILDSGDSKPRYTFDLTNPIVKQVERTMSKSDYTLRVRPNGGKASEDTAGVYDGLLRNIQSISDADQVYSKAGRSVVVGGIDGFEVVHDYVDGDTFEQDLLIKGIPNFIDSVWFGPHKEQDASDARYAWKIWGLDKEEFEEKHPERAANASLSSDRSANAYYHRNDLVMVGLFYYLKEDTRDLVLMSNGKVYEDDEDFKKVKDELAALEVTEIKRRERKTTKLCIRKFDSSGWWGEAKETVFRHIPLVPIYGNFDYFEDKVLYFGAVEKLIDPQRVFNYSMSREVEEGALAPRAKYWMTEKQAQGHGDQLETLNTNTDPVQFYNPDEEAPGPPQQQGGAQINPGLRTISEATQQIMGMTAGMFAANMGDNPGLQSGVAIEALQDRGDMAHSGFVEAREVAMTRLGRILVDAIPRVYRPARQVRLLHEDGSIESKTIGEQVLDEQTGEVVTLNDLSEGTYDVTCVSGAKFENRQSETVRTLVELGQVDPAIIQMSSDVLANNVQAPGMGDVAGRARAMLLQQGLIPEDQWTDEERAKAQEAMQMAQMQPQEDPMMVAARAEEAKAQADLVDAQTKQMQTSADVQQKNASIEVDRFNAQTKRIEAETAQIEAAVKAQEAGVNIEHIKIKARKDAAEAEAQEIENAAVDAGIVDLARATSGEG